MGRQCARPNCSAPAVAAFNFDGLNRIVWLNPINDRATHDGPRSTAGDLCQEHADRFRPPVHWELRDLRSGELDVRIIEPPPERPVPLGGKPTAPRRDPSPPGGDEAGEPTPDESTPLLARAFRAAG